MKIGKNIEIDFFELSILGIIVIACIRSCAL